VPPVGGDESLQFRRWLVQELVTREVLIHEARAAGLIEATPPVADALDGTLTTLPQAVLTRLFEIVTADVAVPESELRAYYERNLDLFSTEEVRGLRHHLSPTEADARAAARTIDQGASWNLRRGEFTGPFEDAVFAAAPGELVGPLESELGWHVARVERIDAPSIASFVETRERIAEELLAVARAGAFREWLERRRQAISVIEPDWEHPGHPVHGLVRHRH
jgi:[acyl-carrier-protein] S-malonyltransferase